MAPDWSEAPMPPDDELVAAFRAGDPVPGRPRRLPGQAVLDLV
jgi:hypothetical protein